MKNLAFNETYTNSSAADMPMTIKTPAYFGGWFEFTDTLKPGESMTRTQINNRVFIHTNTK